ncbi:MAG: glycerophosphodiester phosphodiesterase [Gammaproteobacteria bacterium]
MSRPHMTLRSPAVVAHRGASGYLPEHTREAKVLAHGQGADYLEQDFVATRDGHLVVFHDLQLDDVTDVAAKFPERRRPDGRHYVIDFDLEELLTLRVVERRAPGTGRPAYPERFTDESLAFRIVPLDEELRLIRELNRTTGRATGIYPELKAPMFHRRHGVDLAALLLDTLARHGFSEPDDPVIVQCFDPIELARCRRELGTRLKLAQLVDTDAPPDAYSPRTLAAVAAYADVLAPPWTALIEATTESPRSRPEIAASVEEARKAGLELHPFTFRKETVPECFESFEAQLEFFFAEIGVSALFCDQPDIAVRVRDALTARGSGGPETPDKGRGG